MTDPIVLCEISVVTTTVASEAEARGLAQSALQARAAACVQVEPITAHYHWKGAPQEDRELRVVCKTLPHAVTALLVLLRSQHPYTLPQLVVQTARASQEYYGWVESQLLPSASGD